MSKSKRQGWAHVARGSYQDQSRAYGVLGGRTKNGYRLPQDLEQVKGEIERIKQGTSSLSSNQRKAMVIWYFKLLDEDKNKEKLPSNGQ